MAARQIGDGNTDGNVLGHSASDKIAFHGNTPIAQRAGAAQVALTDSSGGAASDTLAAATNTTALTHAVGAADGTVADVGAAFSQGTLNDNFREITTQLATQRTLNTVLINALASIAAKNNELRATLVALGLMKGSA